VSANAPSGFVASPAGYRLLDPAACRAHLVERQAAFAAAVAAGDLDASVPTCPGWTLRRLAWHLGGVHRWARGAVAEGRPVDVAEVGPDARSELVAWYREGAAELVGLLEATPPDAECWSFGPKPRTARFWSRRQAHETAIHALDAQLAVGVDTPGAALDPIQADLALDGIDEVVTMFFPRQVRLGRIEPLRRSLAIEPDDGAGLRWVLTGDGTTPSDQLPDAEATLRGPADLLLRVLWKRLRPDPPAIIVDGDQAAARAMLGARITP
jgi:uncharacterized protein (TIGR03083 family)